MRGSVVCEVVGSVGGRKASVLFIRWLFLVVVVSCYVVIEVRKFYFF